MNMITAHLPHTPRTLGARFETITTPGRRALRQLRRWHEGFVSDRHTSVCERTLRPYSESRFHV